MQFIIRVIWFSAFSIHVISTLVCRREAIRFLFRNWYRLTTRSVDVFFRFRFASTVRIRRFFVSKMWVVFYYSIKCICRQDNAVAYIEMPLKYIVIYTKTSNDAARDARLQLLYSYLLYRLGRVVFAFSHHPRRKRRRCFWTFFYTVDNDSCPFLFVRIIGNPSSTKTVNSYVSRVYNGTRISTETLITKSFDWRISNNRGSVRIQITHLPPDCTRFHTHIYLRIRFSVWRA